MRWKSHVRFGGRAEETDWVKGQHRASVRSDHFVATELLTEGIDVRTVANRLGHARTSTTMDIYWAFVPARDRDAADHLEAVLRPD